MDTREKLVELLKTNACPSPFMCDPTCKYYGFGDCFPDRFADYLINNGVTVKGLDGCKYCKEYEDLPEHFIDDKPVGRVFDTCIQTDENGRWHIEVPSGADIGIKFCPMCGRRLPQPIKGE